MRLNKGFSLLEAGVSILILSIALLTIFQSISFNNSNLDSIKKKAFARQIIINRISYGFIDPIRINSSRSFDYVFNCFFWVCFNVGTNPPNAVRPEANKAALFSMDLSLADGKCKISTRLAASRRFLNSSSSDCFTLLTVIARPPRKAHCKPLIARQNALPQFASSAAPTPQARVLFRPRIRADHKF